MRRTVPPVESLAASNLQLDAFVVNRVDDRLVAVLDVILRNLTLVDLHPFLQKIDCEGLLEKGGAFVLLILQDAHYRRRLPFLLAARSGNTGFRQRLGDVGSGFSQKELAVYVPYNLCFIFDNLRQAVFTLFVAKELLVANADFSIRKALALTPGHVV